MPETGQTGYLSVCLGVPLYPPYDSLCSPRWRLLGDTARACVASKLPRSIPKKRVGRTRVDQNARGVVKGVVKGVTRASFGCRAPLTPQLKRASARRREEKVFRGST